MKKKWIALMMIPLVSTLMFGCSASKTAKGAGAGAVAGGVLGGIIGHQSDHKEEGGPLERWPAVQSVQLSDTAWSSRQESSKPWKGWKGPAFFTASGLPRGPGQA